MFQDNRDSWKLNVTYQFVFYDDDIIILAGREQNIKKNT
jgi:hypothetical protein